MLKRLYIVNGQYLGASPILRTWEKSIAFCCEHCSEVYARLPVENTKWIIYSGCCEKCESDTTRAPGSIWVPGDNNYFNNFPFNVQERELELYIKAWEASKDD